MFEANRKARPLISGKTSTIDSFGNEVYLKTKYLTLLMPALGAIGPVLVRLIELMIREVRECKE